MKNYALFVSLVFLLPACSDPTAESGKPDAVPSTPEQAASQQTDLQVRKEALHNQGLCTPDAIRNSEHPDEHWYHCQGKPWTGTTSIQDLLVQFQDDPKAHMEYCSNPYTKVANYWDVICQGTDALSMTQKEGK